MPRTPRQPCEEERLAEYHFPHKALLRPNRPHRSDLRSAFSDRDHQRIHDNNHGHNSDHRHDSVEDVLDPISQLSSETGPLQPAAGLGRNILFGKESGQVCLGALEVALIG